MDETVFDDIPEITPIDSYNIEEGKLRASIKWLIARIFERNIPDKLQNAFFVDEQGRLQLTSSVITALTNGSLYAQAAAKIFHDQSLITQGHASVLLCLSSQFGIEVMDVDNSLVIESTLHNANPIKTSAHLALIDALMVAHVRSIITTEHTVEAVQRYTSVDKREEPIDPVDALLFWINKICLLVRDDMEKAGSSSSDSTTIVPEMEDLYEDLCDGACVCALVAFYRSQQLRIESICFNDPMSIGDCQYNLMLLRRFCNRHLPWNIFHFEIEDILYLHENLQPNVNAFLADLFHFFEGPFAPQVSVANTTPTPSPSSSSARSRFAPIAAIPDLRSHNSERRPHPPQATNNAAAARVGRAMSTVSTDSLMTNRSNDSLRYHIARNRNFNAANSAIPPTHFADLLQGDAGTNANAAAGGGGYSRSDSLPITSAGVRLAMEEKRRELEKQKLLQSTINESDRQQKGKEAFFALMGRHQQTAVVQPQKSPIEQHEETSANSEDIRYLNETVNRLQVNAHRVHLLNCKLQQQVQQMSAAQLQLARHVDDSARTMSHAISQPAIYNDLSSSPQMQPMTGFNTMPVQFHQPFVQQAPSPPSFSMHQQQQPQPQQHTYAQPFATMASMGQQPPVYQQPFSPPQSNANGYAGAYHVSEPMAANYETGFKLQQQGMEQVPSAQSPFYPDANTFRLHQQNASTSRLDPALELNRNLTNWGLTYKSGHPIRPQRRTWEHETFIKSEMDLVNQPNHVPHAPHQRDQSRAQSVVDDPTIEPLAQRNVLHSQSAREEQQNARQRLSATFEQDDELSKPTRSNGGFANSAIASSDGGRGQQPVAGFVFDDPTPVEKTGPRLTREMEAKRSALLAKTMRRKEKIEQKVEESEARNADRRIAEQQKQELSEQKRIEKELHRQRVLESYLKKKVEKELAEAGGASPSSFGRSGNSRGHSQPPNRPKSQVVDEDRSRTLHRSPRPQSSIDDENSQPPTSARMTVSSIAEPTLKLFSKHTPKSNRNIINNALHYSVFCGAVHDEQRNKVLAELAKNDSKHFLLLFRDQKCQYRGLYSWDQMSDTAHKITGIGPKFCREDMMSIMFKYDSGAKSFSQIPTRHLSATIDGFSLPDQFWQKPKIPHGNAH